MRKAKAVGLTILVCVLLASGCQLLGMATRTERHKLRTVTDTYAATMHTLADLREAGKLTDKQVERVDRWYPVVREGLDEWRAQVEAGKKPEKDTIREVRHGLNVLLAVMEAADEQN